MRFLALSLSDVVFIMLIIVKMPTIVGILTFIIRINFVLSRVEYEKSFITSGPDVCQWDTFKKKLRKWRQIKDGRNKLVLLCSDSSMGKIPVRNTILKLLFILCTYLVENSILFFISLFYRWIEKSISVEVYVEGLRTQYCMKD